MRFECHSTYYPKPVGPDNFIQVCDVSVLCSTTNQDDVVAARIAVDYLDIFRAELEGRNVFDVCDADSSGWEHVYSATIEPAEDFAELRKDFGFQEPVNGLVFIHRAVFHPALRDWQRMIIDSVCNMYPEETATVMWKGATDLTDRELASLGFRIVAGCDLLFRPNMLRSEYSTAEDDREPIVDLSVPPEAEAYVSEQWDRD